MGQVLQARHSPVAQETPIGCNPPFACVILKMNLPPPPKVSLGGVVTWDQWLYTCKPAAVKTMKKPAMDACNDVDLAVVSFEDGSDVFGGEPIRPAIGHKAVPGDPGPAFPSTRVIPD